MGPGAQELTEDDPCSIALEEGEEEDTPVAVEADLGELEGSKQAKVDVREYGEKELATGGTDPSMVEEGGEHKQPEMDPHVLKEGEQEPTSGETDPRVLEDGGEELIQEQASGMFACG